MPATDRSDHPGKNDAPASNEKLCQEALKDLALVGVGVGVCAWSIKSGRLQMVQKALPELEQAAFGLYGNSLKLLGKAPRVERLLTTEGAEFQMHRGFVDGVQCKAVTGTLGEHEVTVTSLGTRTVTTPQGLRWGEGLSTKFQIEDDYRLFGKCTQADVQGNKRLFNTIESNFYTGRTGSNLFKKATQPHPGKSPSELPLPNLIIDR